MPIRGGPKVARPIFSNIVINFFLFLFFFIYCVRPLLFWLSFSKFITSSTPDLVENNVLFFWEMHIIHKYMSKKLQPTSKFIPGSATDANPKKEEPPTFEIERTLR